MPPPLSLQIPESREDALRFACELQGVQNGYWDIFGNHHVASPEVQQAILRSMGMPVDDLEQLRTAISLRLASEWARVVAPTIVASQPSGIIPVQLKADDLSRELHCEFRWEDGTSHKAVYSASSLAEAASAHIDGQRYLRLNLPLPSAAPLGYHRLIVDGVEARLILCPDRAFKPPFLEAGRKGAGLAISLYGLRSDRNWGCGDFTDLERLTTWASLELGVSFVALNPLHSIPNRQPYNTSPYLPNCSFYRNPLYLDVERIDEVQDCPLAQRLLSSERFRQRLGELRAAEFVEYEKVWRVKLRVLKLGFRQALRSGLPAAFREWSEREGTLLHVFAVYCALDELLHKRDRNCWIWPDWAEEYREPDAPEVADFAAAHPRLVTFYKWMQWQIDRQLEAAQRHARACGMSIGLYHDLALATDRCGSDLWAHRRFYVAGCRVGSPPDDFSPKGQDWAFPPPNSARHHDEGYGLFVESIRKNLRHGGALRIDHVMRFFRLFWIPDGKEAIDGVYVHDYSDDLLHILALESVRHQTLVVGEDLGTVEPYIREALANYGILSYRLLYFEKNKDGSFRNPAHYPVQALVSASTHDLATAAGFWTGRDIEARKAAGVLRDETDYRNQWAARLEEKQHMLDLFHQCGLLPSWFPRRADGVPEFTGELHNAVVGALATTPCELMVLSVEDLFKQPDQQNLPGTTAEYPNWRGKMRYTLAELETDEVAKGCARMYRDWLERTGRLDQPTGN